MAIWGSDSSANPLKWKHDKLNICQAETLVPCNGFLTSSSRLIFTLVSFYNEVLPIFRTFPVVLYCFLFPWQFVITLSSLLLDKYAINQMRLHVSSFKLYPYIVSILTGLGYSFFMSSSTKYKKYTRNHSL